MADDKDQEKKIRELEESLAKELDQAISLSTTNDPRVSGAVELNPAINPQAPTAKAGPSTYEPVPKNRDVDVAVEPAATPPPKEDEVSLEDLDSILNQEMPELQQELAALREAGNAPEVQNADLGSFEVADEGGAEVGEMPKKLSLRRRLAFRSQEVLNRTVNVLYSLPIKTYKYTVKFIKEDAKNLIAAIVHKTAHHYKSLVTAIKDMTWLQRLSILGMLLASITIVFVLVSPIGPFHITAFDLHENFVEAAQERIHFDGKAPFVPLSEDGQYPENVVLVEKVVVNIKPSRSSTSNPMVAMRLYFEMSTHEAAVEIKDREKEVRDLTQRVLETFNYDQIISAEGKKTFKEALRREMSSILNTGIVRNVYIDDILIKP